MARKINRLSAAFVAKAPIGQHPDGGGLYLDVHKGGRSWIFRYKRGHKQTFMGLGPTYAVNLAEAREKRRQCHQLLLEGIDPLEHRRARVLEQRAAERLTARKAVTFREHALEYVETHESAWTPRHSREWTDTLERYAFPELGSLPLQEVNTDAVVKALKPIWIAKHDTGARLRRRIEAIMSSAKARGLVQGDNPVELDTLRHLLPARPKNGGDKHHEAMDYREVGAFMADLRKVASIPARAMEFLVLTAARTGEVLGMEWSEVDFAEKVWKAPASRMKSGREHRVPLSGRAFEVLQQMWEIRSGGLVFPGHRGKLGHGIFRWLLKEELKREATPHGMRATFKTWATEQTHFPVHIVEMALAHAIHSGVERAYQRGDLFEKRRKLMDAWGSFCAAPKISAKLLSMKR